MKMNLYDVMPPTMAHQVLQMLENHDHDFLPPLSARTGTAHKFSDERQDDREMSGVEAYFDELSAQGFVSVADECDGGKERLAAFLSFKRDHECKPIDCPSCTYITTIIVDDAYRGGLASEMYEKLIEDAADRAAEEGESDAVIALRTWDSEDDGRANKRNIHIAEKLGFELTARIKDDREDGVDTVYLVKTVSTDPPII